MCIRDRFHTIKLQKASEEFAKCLQNVQFNEPKVDIIKNLDGRIYSKEDNINQILEKHIISPVRFDKAIDLMKDIGIDAVSYTHLSAEATLVP